MLSSLLPFDNDINNWIYSMDPNGATRQVGLSALLFLAASVAAVALFVALPFVAKELHVKQTSLKAARRRMLILTPVAFAMMVLAYTVRNPCRPDYYIGCGVNRCMYTGLALAIIVLAYAIAMIKVGKQFGWALAAYAVYYAHYELGFTHAMGGFVQLMILLTVLTLILVWIWSLVISALSLYLCRTAPRA